MANILLYLLLGLFTGTLSGLMGIGGGILIIPTLIYLFGLTQHRAQGTAIASMLLSVGLLAAIIVYYKQGYVNLKIAIFIYVGYFIGGLLGAKFAVEMSPTVLRKVFGFYLFLISLHMILFK